MFNVLFQMHLMMDQRIK